MSLKVYCGPMFSSKSSRLVEEVNRYTDISKDTKALIINHKLDTRDTEKVISSHSSLYKGLSNNIDTQTATRLSDVDVSNYTIIGIDELNFFDDKDDLLTTIKRWLSEQKHIIAVGLDGDSNMNKFGHISELVHLADSFVKLNAICTTCVNQLIANGETLTPTNMTPAPFTKRLIHHSPTASTNNNVNNIIEVGGADIYQCCCRKHHC